MLLEMVKTQKRWSYIQIELNLTYLDMTYISVLDMEWMPSLESMFFDLPPGKLNEAIKFQHIRAN